MSMLQPGLLALPDLEKLRRAAGNTAARPGIWDYIEALEAELNRLRTLLLVQAQKGTEQ